MKKTIKNMTINYRIRHNKNTDHFLLFLHGWGGSLDSFKGVEDVLVKNGFSTINMDFPGFGHSDLPSNDFTLNDYKEIVVEILNNEKIDKVSVFGHSFGGRVAILLASETDFVDKLILIDSAGIKPRFNLIKWFKIRKYKFLKWCNKKLKTKFDLSKFGSEDYKAIPKELKQVFNNIVNLDLTKKLKNIKAKSLIVWGERDKSTPLYMAKKINRNIQNSSLVIYKNCGHFSYIENFNEFCNLTITFLK